MFEGVGGKYIKEMRKKQSFIASTYLPSSSSMEYISSTLATEVSCVQFQRGER